MPTQRSRRPGRYQDHGAAKTTARCRGPAYLELATMPAGRSARRTLSPGLPTLHRRAARPSFARLRDRRFLACVLRRRLLCLMACSLVHVLSVHARPVPLPSSRPTPLGQRARLRYDFSAPVRRASLRPS